MMVKKKFLVPVLLFVLLASLGLLALGAVSGGVELPGAGEPDGKRIRCDFVVDEDIFTGPDIESFGCVKEDSCRVGGWLPLAIFTQEGEVRLVVDGKLVGSKNVELSSFSSTSGNIKACVPVNAQRATLQLLGDDGVVADSAGVSI